MRTVINVLLTIVVLFGIYVGYGVYAEKAARAQADEFCAGVKLGEKADGLVEKGLAAGAQPESAKWMPGANGERTLLVTFVGMPPFSRHICRVKAKDVVVSADYTYLD